ncbi:MAG TPA: Gfo/Idh/MocA family oxidoreductase [Phycisphaerae bacterium]|nr:Gfo/Idh/MocA family oxidoreductase [Phycisphaerae bacterium]
MAKTQQTPIGIIGCGNISETYLRMCSRFENLRVAACADLDMDRARAKAAAFPGVRALTVDELLADKQIRIVVNLTTPQAHASVALAALKAGKSVHNEKPLAILTRRGKAAQFACVLEPVAKGREPAVTAVEVQAEAAGMRIRIRRGTTTDTVTLTSDHQFTVTCGDTIVLTGK